MGRRNCASCKFYERSSIVRMGWCRNPQIYASHHNHLVSADDLDCDRGAGDFWEPVPGESARTLINTGHSNPAMPAITITTSGSPIYPVSGSSGYSSDPPPPGPGDSGGPPWGNEDRDFNYYSEDRYWTDYLRIAAPILGVIVLVILLWFWIASFLGDDNGDDDDVAAGTATESVLPTFEPTADPTEAASGTASPPGVAPTQPPGGENGATATTAPDEGTEDPGGGDGPVEVYLGATVEVANTDGAGVNVRSDSTTTSEVLTVFLDGTQVEVIGGPVEGENFTWWQITGNEVASGWIVEEYLEVIE